MAMLVAVAFFTPLRRFLDKRVEAWYAKQSEGVAPPGQADPQLDARSRRIVREELERSAKSPVEEPDRP